MPLYSYILRGGPGGPASADGYDLPNDDDAVALSIAVLRDAPRCAQVWVMEGDEPVAVRVRAAGRPAGLLLRMR